MMTIFVTFAACAAGRMTHAVSTAAKLAHSLAALSASMSDRRVARDWVSSCTWACSASTCSCVSARGGKEGGVGGGGVEGGVGAKGEGQGSSW